MVLLYLSVNRDINDLIVINESDGESDRNSWKGFQIEFFDNKITDFDKIEEIHKK